MEDFDFSECFERLFLDNECKTFKIKGPLVIWDHYSVQIRMKW